MKDLLLSYAHDLDDAYPGYEFSIWTKKQLLGYFNEALCLVAAYRPDLFTELKVVKVELCNNYLDLCNCAKVLDVLGQTDKNGKSLRPLNKRSKKTAVWTGRTTNKQFTSELTEYELVENSNLVRVYPSNLDPTKELYVLIRCSMEAKAYTLDDAAPNEHCAFLAAVRQWVLYNAKMVDGEFSQSMQKAAKEHREIFTGILQLVEQGDDKYDKDDKSIRRR